MSSLNTSGRKTVRSFSLFRSWNKAIAMAESKEKELKRLLEGAIDKNRILTLRREERERDGWVNYESEVLSLEN